MSKPKKKIRPMAMSGLAWVDVPIETWVGEFDKKFKVYLSAYEQYGKIQRHGPLELEIIDVPVAEFKAFIRTLLKQQRKEMVGRVKGEKKGVKELFPNPTPPFEDLSIQVAFKEGYNKALSDVIEVIEKEGE